MNYLNQDYQNLNDYVRAAKTIYKNNSPYPHIAFENFLNPEIVKLLIAEFPDLEKAHHIKYNNPNEKKFASVGETEFGECTKNLLHFLNSQSFLEFLQELTGIKETLIPDSYFEGAGYHQIKRGGFLKIHSDFNKHVKTNLDRRLNLLIYLNDGWKEEFGGHFELWSADMKKCEKKVLPVSNTVVIFSTTDFSYHGHPNPLKCPDNMSRRSIAIYYYSNGRPAIEVDQFRKDHPALFLPRGTETTDRKMKAYNSILNTFMEDLLPPIIVKSWKKLIISVQKSKPNNINHVKN